MAGDTTEDELSFPEENDYGGDQENSNPAEPKMVSMDKTDLEDPGQILFSGDSNTVALECVAE